GGMFGAMRDPNMPSPMQSAKAVKQREKYSGSLAERRAQFEADCRAWADGKKVYVVGTQAELNQLGRVGSDLTVVGHVALKAEPVEPQGRGRGAGGVGP